MMGSFHRWGMLLAFVVILGCAYLGIRMVFVEDKDSEMPAVTGMQLVDAVDALQERGLLAKVDKIDSPLPADTVVSQNLTAGEKVSRGKVVLLRVSKGGALLPIPDVRGMKFEEGVRKLADSGFKVDKITRVTDKLKPSGTIIAQNPASPQKVASNCMVSLLVSNGTSGKSAFITVPDLRGQTQESATTMIEQLGLRVGQISHTASTSMPAGTVVSSRPRNGASVPSGSLINLTFARAPLASEVTTEVPPSNDQDKERAEAVRKVVVRETAPTTIPSKVPAVDPAAAKKAQAAKAAATTPAVTTPAATTTKTTTAAATAPKTETQKAVAQAQQQAQQQATTAKTQTTTKKATSSKPQKIAKVRYQAPPLAKPLSLKIELADEFGTRVLKDGMAQSGEYVSMNVPYSGEARITIYLGGEFVWQDRYN